MFSSEPVRPAYDGGWIGALIPALLSGSPPDWLPEPVRGADRSVLLVLDGFGWSALETHRPALPTLGALAGGPITAVAPTTTAAALTSIATGLPPAEHGIVGYRMRVAGQVLNVLRWQFPGGAGGPAPETVQPTPPFLGRPVPIVTRGEFRTTGFSAAHLRGARWYGWRTTATLVHHCRLLTCAGESFAYAYYDGVDKVAHEYGLRDGFYRAELVAADRLVADLLDALTGDVALLVTADHGQVHVGPGAVRSLRELAPLVAAYAGEGRFRSLYARPGAVAELVAAANERFGDVAWVLTRDELFDGGWLGPGGSALTRGRVGDVVLAARTATAFADPGEPNEAKLVACHGSLTADEMLVPLLAARGRA